MKSFNVHSHMLVRPKPCRLPRRTPPKAYQVEPGSPHCTTPLVLAARVPIKLPFSSQKRLGLTKGSCHAHIKQDTPGSEKRLQASPGTELSEAEMAEGAWWMLSPTGARSPHLGSEPSASTSIPTIMFCFMPQTGRKAHLAEEVVAL